MRFFPEMGKISPQHQTSTTLSPTCGGNRATPAFPCSRLCSPTSTPKPRAEGSSPSAPAKKERQASACLSFFVATGVKPRHAERVGHRRRSAACGGYSEAGMAQRSAIGKAALPPQTEPGTARGLAKQVQVRPSISAMLWRTSPPFPCFIALFLTRLHLSSPAPNPSSTRNAPGFALFGLFRVRFSLFRCFSAAKFSPWFLCNLQHSAHKLKPSVIPCKREVSFLT